MRDSLPHLLTPRLMLKPIHKGQAETLSVLANEPSIANNTANLPSPYTLEVARDFIDSAEEKYLAGDTLALGTHLRDTGELIGLVSIRLSTRHHSGLLGGWTAVEYRDRGYAVESACGLMHFCFNELALNRIGGQCFSRNKASERVMEKIGLVYEGRLQGALLKNARYEDVSLFGVLRENWRNPIDACEHRP